MQVTTLVDDLDGDPGQDVLERTFAVGSMNYVVDLSEKNWKQFLDAIDYMLEVARKGSAAPRPKKASSGASTPAKPKNSATTEIRDWARLHGYEVSERGRISNEIVAAYEAENTPATERPIAKLRGKKGKLREVPEVEYA